MAAMGAAHSGDAVRVRSGGKPIEQFGADRAAPMRAVSRVHRTLAPRDHQHNARAHRSRLIQTGGDASVSGVESVAMQIESEIRLNPA